MSGTVYPVFGSSTPFAEPNWYQGYATPFYRPSHLAYRAKVRSFVDTELVPFVHAWDESGVYPRELHQKAYLAGVYGSSWPHKYGGKGPEDADQFHRLILDDELARCGSGGIIAAVWTPMSIALPPVLHHGCEELKNRIVPEIIRGEKLICLCITEPNVGSDVANVETTAVRDGDHFVINGLKKFITGGGYADYFVVLCRTGENGMGGLTVFLVEKAFGSITTRRIPTQGWWTSYTALVEFDNVRVPAKNILGKISTGFSIIMVNFNQERFSGIVMALRFARNCLEDSINYARQRKAFGKTLNQSQVLRHSIVRMASRVTALQAWLEEAAFQFSSGTDEVVLGRTVAMMKVEATTTLEFCARTAAQIFGGNSYVRGGPGERVERIYRETRVLAIGGGSEEIMLDLTAKMAKL